MKTVRDADYAQRNDDEHVLVTTALGRGFLRRILREARRLCGTCLFRTARTDGAATYTPGVGERRGSTTKHYGADLKNEVAQISTMQTISASKQYDA
ncbi:MAG: hypothetical protein U0R49_07725 [Fimbriimonadales bacterium]